MKTLAAHERSWKLCQDCPLGKEAMKHVFYRGSKRCDLLFVGEAPGNSEDVIGVPFIGPAGKLLDRILSEASHPLNFTWGMTNVVCCIPLLDKQQRSTRSPSKEEAKACRPRLEELISIVQPKGLVLVGTSATKYVSWCKLPKESIVHPAAMLRKQDYYVDFLRAVDQIRAFVVSLKKEGVLA